MAAKDFLQNRVGQTPTIYAYELVGVPDHEGLIKVGFTVRDVEERIKEQLGTVTLKHRTLLVRAAMRQDGSVKTVERAIESVREGRSTMTQRTQRFSIRPEQERAVDKTAAYFTSFIKDPDNRGLTPHFLWNAKMRFGKGFVRSIDDKYIIANFGFGDKKFLYPSIFEREYMFVISPGDKRCSGSHSRGVIFRWLIISVLSQIPCAKWLKALGFVG